VRLSRLAALLTCSAAAGAGPAVPARLAARLDSAADEVVARVRVPSEQRPVGEVRLLRRGDADVVQTLLYTKVLSRVVGEIRKKELANWPAPPGRADATRYVDALAATQERLWKALPTDPKADRRQKLWIEFVLAPDAAFVAIGRFEMAAEEPVRVALREPLVWLEPTRDYVRANMRLIAADSFHVAGADLESLLAPLVLLRGEAAAADPARERVP
jgi:hypothetical protein